MSDEREQSQDAAAMALFDDETAEKVIRRIWHDERWFFSVIKDEGGDETVTKCNKLKMTAADGKERETDVADAQTMLQFIQSVPSPKAEPIKQWLACVGTERLAEIEDPSLAVERARMEYLQKGYSDEWIERRLQRITIREQLTDERQFAKLTNILHEGTFDVKVAEHKQIKDLKPRQDLRDSMTTLELLLTGLAEETAKTLRQARASQGMSALQRDTREAGEVGGAARRDIEQRNRRPVVSAENYRSLTRRRNPTRASGGRRANPRCQRQSKTESKGSRASG